MSPVYATYIEHTCPKCGYLNDGYKEWDTRHNEPLWTTVTCPACGTLYEFDMDGGTRE